MKKLILILSLVCCLQSCSQKPNLNKEEMIAEFTKHTHNPSLYNTHPQYRLEQYTMWFNFCFYIIDYLKDKKAIFNDEYTNSQLVKK